MIYYKIKSYTDISSNSIEVNTLGKVINVKPGEPICKPAVLTSR